MIGVPRRVRALEDPSIHDLIVQIRWERAKRDALVPGSAAHVAIGVTEFNLIRELHGRFGVENIAAPELEWYVQVDHGRGRGEAVRSA